MIIIELMKRNSQRLLKSHSYRYSVIGFRFLDKLFDFV